MTVVKCDFCKEEINPIPDDLGCKHTEVVRVSATDSFGNRYHAEICLCCFRLLRNVFSGHMSENDWKHLIAHVNQARGFAGRQKEGDEE